MLLSATDVQRRSSGYFPDPVFSDVDEVYINPDSGWLNALAALDKVMQAVFEANIQGVQATVTELILDSNGHCIGVRTADSQVISVYDVGKIYGIFFVQNIVLPLRPYHCNR
jgi:sarcosine oxidase / L-pipecolate oxidase